MEIYYDELHKIYKQTVNNFVDSYRFKNDTLSADIDSYLREKSLTFLGQFNVDREICRNCVNQLYSSENNGSLYDKMLVNTILDKVSDDNFFSDEIPEFFERMIQYDILENSSISRKFVKLVGYTLVLVAKTVGQFTQAEASYINESVLSGLYEYCEEKGITGEDNLDVSGFQDTIQGKRTFKSVKMAMDSVNQSIASDPMEELNRMVGLKEVKEDILELKSFIEIQNKRSSMGLNQPRTTNHLVFTGNPGTGKTTVARLLAQIYKNLGVVSKGTFVETTAKDLVSGYVGQTALKTGAVIEKAIGGVLFIDEAYTLSSGGSYEFGQEAIATLLKEMEDHRVDFVVIVAGYEEEMKQFIKSNPGLTSRFNKFIHFDDYSNDELMEIFEQFCSLNSYEIDNETTKGLIRQHLLEEKNKENFANARSVRNYFEKVITKQAIRLYKIGSNKLDDKSLKLITEEDVRSV